MIKRNVPAYAPLAAPKPRAEPTRVAVPTPATELANPKVVKRLQKRFPRK